MKIILSRDALLDVLEYIDIDVNGETGRDFIAYCPYHDNRDSAALNISKLSPYPYRCWNSSCAATGTLLRLVETQGRMTPMQALRFLVKYRTNTESLRELLVRHEEKETYEIWPESRLDKVRVDYGLTAPVAPSTAYMFERGFTLETLKHFEIGYSLIRNRVVIPVRDDAKALVGFSGRAIEDDQLPRYWDKGLPKRFVLFNTNNAIGNGNEVIITEGPLDAMKVSQAGFPCVVATFGGAFTVSHQKKLTHNFSSCIIFTDNPETDEPGLALSNKISEAMRKAGREVSVARYPSGVKDPGEMSEEQIKKAIEEKESILRLRLRLGGTQ